MEFSRMQISVQLGNGIVLSVGVIEEAEVRADDFGLNFCASASRHSRNSTSIVKPPGR